MRLNMHLARRTVLDSAGHAVFNGHRVLMDDPCSDFVRIARTLKRWDERCCGNEHGCIEYDEATGKPQWRDAISGGLWPIRNYERAAMKRLAELCAKHNLTYYRQTDPRGCSLYLGTAPLDGNTYHRDGVPVCA